MRIPLSKLKAILLYFCEHTDGRVLGKTKLMKLFYFSDFLHIKKYGSPITFDDYVNLDHGPIPSVIKNLVDDVPSGRSGIADTISVNIPEGRRMHRIAPLRELTEDDLNLFSEDEIAVLSETCERFRNTSNTEIENISHEEAAWSETNYLDQIPYELAARDSDSTLESEEIKLILKTLS